MKELAYLGAFVGMVFNIPLLIGVLNNKIKQNFVTYLLWGIMDIILVVTIFRQGGNYWLPLGYGIGSLSVAIALMLKVRASWTRFQTMVVILTFCCMVVWVIIGNRAGNIATTVAIGIASIPQMRDTYKYPEETPTWLFFGFGLAALLSFFGSNDWTVEDKLFPLGSFIVCSIITILSTRK